MTIANIKTDFKYIFFSQSLLLCFILCMYCLESSHHTQTIIPLPSNTLPPLSCLSLSSSHPIFLSLSLRQFSCCLHQHICNVLHQSSFLLIIICLILYERENVKYWINMLSYNMKLDTEYYGLDMSWVSIQISFHFISPLYSFLIFCM